MLDLHSFEKVLRAAAPPLLFGLRFWASVSLALYVAFWLELDNAYWAGATAAIVCQPHLGASMRKGWYRMIGSLIGAVAIVVLTACAPQDRALFLGALALWCGACAFAATLLRNFAAYGAALAGFTAAIVASNLVGPSGEVDGDAAFLLAVSRASEISIGIVCAGIVLAGTDLGGARRHLAVLIAGLSAEIVTGFAGAVAGRDLHDTRSARREFLRRIIALDPVIDEAIGESSQLRYHSPVLQRAADGLFAVLGSWRVIASHLSWLPHNQAQEEGAVVLEGVPQELLSASEDEPTRWLADPVGLHRICKTTVRRLITLPVRTPSLRLIADEAAEAFDGMADALDGLALLVADSTRPSDRGSKRVRVPDWLPALINAGRAFVTISAVALFWIVTEWPNGALAIAFAAGIVLLLTPRADQAYAAGAAFMAGALIDVGLAAVVAFAMLPRLGPETFAGFSLVIGLCLVPIGTFVAQARQPWQTGMSAGMAILFIPLLQPANQMNYNPEQYYNTTMAIITGTAVALLSFRMLPPLSPAVRTRRLLALTLRDLRSLAMGRAHGDWVDQIRSRLVAMPDAATPLQRAQLLAALSVGSKIIQLQDDARRLGLGADLGAAIAAVAQGDSAIAIANLARLDEVLAAADAAGGPGAQTALRARAKILALSEALTEHAAYFDAGASR
jgi:uncharacterized membrane protein YccC